MQERRIPYNPETELAFLNLVLNHAELYFKAEEAGITPGLFLNASAGKLYSVITSLVEQGKGEHPRQFDIVHALKNTGTQEDYDYFKECSLAVIAPHFFDRYLFRLVDTHKKREALRLAQELAQIACDEHTPSEAALMFATSAIEKIEQTTKVLEVMDATTWSDRMAEYYAKAHERTPGISWGLADFDTATKGTRLGEYTIVKATEGSGKSALLQQVAHYRAQQGRPQLWITIGDMTAEQVFNRLMQQQTGVSSVDLSYGNFVDRKGFDHKRKIDANLERFKELPFYIFEGGFISSPDIKRIVKMMLRRESCFDIYVDYMQQLADPGDVYEATSSISKNLLDTAHNLRDKEGNHLVSLTAISAMNKAGDHFGVKRIAHDAENIFSLEMEKLPSNADALPYEQKVNRKVKVTVEKQRNGPRDFYFVLWFNGVYTRFEDYTEQDNGRGW